MLVSDTKCLEGKRHKWKLIATEGQPYLPRHEYKWCKCCGSFTEFVIEANKRPQRCKNDDGSCYIEVPEAMK